MSRWHSYLNSATAILDGYQGDEPFSSFIKKYFSQHKKYGGQDRKWISHLCYCFFRLGKALPSMPVPERILFALLFCSSGPNALLEKLQPGWNDLSSATTREKIKRSGISFSLHNIFPWVDELDDALDPDAFFASFLIQPDLFLRLRPGYETKVKEKLTKGEQEFREIRPGSLAVNNSTAVNEMIQVDKEAVIQDYSSQRTGDLLTQLSGKIKTVWDCCAASGGKSIMAADLLGNISLTVSDVRSTIIANLRKRFASAGIENYDAIVTNLETGPADIDGSFDLVIADVPCTGSGTWSRTPEQLYFFEPGLIDKYAGKQKKILSNVIQHVKPCGYLLYCTCSVFKKENEEQVKELVHSGFSLVEQQTLLGYHLRADTLFAALLKKQ